MSRVRITLPWPPSGLQPHAKGSRWAKSSATRAYRRDAFYLARAAGVATIPDAILTITYCPPDRRARDAQNLPGMLKPAIDGIADAMGCDDRGFRVRVPDSFVPPVPGGAIIVEISTE